jgi:inhibitor of KinA
MTFTALGDAAVVVSLGAGIDERVLPKVRALAAALERNRPAGIVDVVAAYSTVTVFYESGLLPHGGDRAYDHVCQVINERSRHVDFEMKKAPLPPARLVEVPVCYSGEFGPDLDLVAQHGGLEISEVIKRYQAATYLVHAIGFLPGFPYLGGLPPELATPRRATPRTLVPAGSVGIGGAQTGVYSMATPGGWQIIGRTPLVLFHPGAADPALLRVGDRVKFRTITPDEFSTWK